MAKKQSIIFCDSFMPLVNHYKKYNRTFTVSVSGYSTTLETETEKILITESPRSLAMFKATQKIIRDVKLLQPDIPKVDRHLLDYYAAGTSLRELEKFCYELPIVYNVDISAAYPTGLFNAGAITKETFDYLMTLHKSIRLKCVGSLAASKQIFSYKKGEFISRELKRKEEYRNLFFYVCKFVDTIMQDCATAIGDSYLFYWVDGIYFSNEDSRERVCKIMDNMSFPYKCETLTDFKAERKDNLINIQFVKDGKIKPFQIPLIAKIQRQKDFYSLH